MKSIGYGVAIAALLALAACGPRRDTNHVAVDRAGAIPSEQTDAQGQAAHQSEQAAGGGGLADGTYDCGDGEHPLGKVDIQGGTYRYRPLDASGGDFAPYSVGADGVITWGGRFPGLDDPPSHLTASTKQPFGFNVNFQVTAGSYEDTMSCNGPGK